MLYYTYKFNMLNHQYEIIEHFPELEKLQVIQRVDTEMEAKKECMVFNEYAELFRSNFSKKEIV